MVYTLCELLKAIRDDLKYTGVLHRLYVNMTLFYIREFGEQVSCNQSPKGTKRQMYLQHPIVFLPDNCDSDELCSHFMKFEKVMELRLGAPIVLIKLLLHGNHV